MFCIDRYLTTKLHLPPWDKYFNFSNSKCSLLFSFQMIPLLNIVCVSVYMLVVASSFFLCFYDKNCDNHLNPSEYPIRRTTLHMYNSIGRVLLLLSGPLSFPYVSCNPNAYLSSSSEAADGMSILLPSTRNGTSSNSSEVNNASSSFLASGNRPRSMASTRYTTPSTVVK